MSVNPGEPVTPPTFSDTGEVVATPPATSDVEVSTESSSVTGPGYDQPGPFKPAPQVTAWRFQSEVGAELATWCGGTFYAASPHFPAYLTLDNEAGDAANVGDWVIEGADGGFRVARDADFRATYVPLESPPASGGGP